MHWHFVKASGTLQCGECCAQTSLAWQIMRLHVNILQSGEVEGLLVGAAVLTSQKHLGPQTAQGQLFQDWTVVCATMSCKGK